MIFDKTIQLLIGTILFLVIVLDVTAINDLRQTEKSKRFKLIFSLVILFIPVFGFSAYYIYKSIENWR